MIRCRSVGSHQRPRTGRHTARRPRLHCCHRTPSHRRQRQRLPDEPCSDTNCWDRPLALAGIDHLLFCRSTVGSFADQPSALSPVTESTIERTNTRIIGPAGTKKPHRNTQFTRTSTRRKMNSVLDGDERRGAYAPISWLHFTGLVHIQRRSTGWFYSQGSAP
jgi:hypothetical protein